MYACRRASRGIHNAGYGRVDSCLTTPFLLVTGEGVANHRDGGCDPTELAQSVQPANTARPVETTRTIIPQPVMGGSRLSSAQRVAVHNAGSSAGCWRPISRCGCALCASRLSRRHGGSREVNRFVAKLAYDHPTGFPILVAALTSIIALMQGWRSESHAGRLARFCWL